ncbi:MAG TPA: four helix bundle protein [Thermoanaerobaculia bacterium]|nr:four helix bundle protein [Thermoanaerobaculia bacterium]
MRIENGGRAGDDIRARSFEFGCAAVELHRFVWRNDPPLRDVSRQFLRAATSIGANLEEADAAQSRADFISKCNIALKEARESHYWLRILGRLLKHKELSLLVTESNELVAILTSIVRNARERKP